MVGHGNSEDIDTVAVDKYSGSSPHSCAFSLQSVSRNKDSSELFYYKRENILCFLKITTNG